MTQSDAFNWSFGDLAREDASQQRYVAGTLRVGVLFGGRFHVERFLGQGAMGLVLQARDASTGRNVAIKLLMDALDDKQRARFRREGELTASLQHAGIIRVYGGGVTTEGRPFLVLELIDGARDLQEVLQTLTDPRDRIDLLLQVARAVGFAHSRGVVHRDLKPENVLVDASGRTRVCDFGLAWHATADRLTRTGAVIGTPVYMSPGQVTAQGPPSPSTDVWALGVMLYNLLTDVFPFEFESGLQVLMAQILRAHPPPPSSLKPELPRSLDAVVAKALQKKPADRYSDGADFADGLEAALHARPVMTLNAKLALGAFAGLGLVAFLAAVGIDLDRLRDRESVAPVTTSEAPAPPSEPAGAPPPTTGEGADEVQPGADDPSPTAPPLKAQDPQEALRPRRPTEVSRLPVKSGKGRCAVFIVAPGKVAIARIYGRRIEIYDLITGADQPVATIRLPLPFLCAAVMGSDLYLALRGDRKDSLVLFRDGVFKTLAEDDPHSDHWRDVVAWRTPAGVRLLELSMPPRIHVLNAEGDGVYQTIELDWKGRALGVAYAPQLDVAAISGRTSGLFPGVYFYSGLTGDSLGGQPLLGLPDTVLGSPRGMLVGTRTGQIFVYGADLRPVGELAGKFPTGKEIPVAHLGTVRDLAMRGDRWLYSLGTAGKALSVLSAWDLNGGQQLFTLELSGPASTLAVDQGSGIVVVGYPRSFGVLQPKTGGTSDRSPR